MHDIRAIRENPAALDAALKRRGEAPMSSEVLQLDEARRAKIAAAENAQAEQNKASKSVGAAKASGDEAEFERLRALVAEKKAEVAALGKGLSRRARSKCEVCETSGSLHVTVVDGGDEICEEWALLLCERCARREGDGASLRFLETATARSEEMEDFYCLKCSA